MFDLQGYQKERLGIALGGIYEGMAFYMSTIWVRGLMRHGM